MTRIRFDGSEEKPQSQPLDCDPPENGATLARLRGGASETGSEGGEEAARLLSRGGVKAGPPQTSSGLGGRPTCPIAKSPAAMLVPLIFAC